MAGITAASHAEVNPNGSQQVVSRLSCSLIGRKQSIYITPNTLTFEIYGKEEIKEQFQCSYGLNEKYWKRLHRGALKIAGTDHQGDVRIVELSNHCFFIATLYLPQCSSSLDFPHPLLVAFIKAARAFRH